jgi:hypothetical protein
MKNRNNVITTILSALGVLAFSPIAQAVSPAPDGGYPGGNTAEGQSALLGLTSGGYNTAVGYLSLASDASGSYNTAVGAGALLANTGEENTATGAAALVNNTTGNGNTANGFGALSSNTTGTGNTATGADALFFNTGSENTANGATALFNNTTGINNTAYGFGALTSNHSGNGNTAIGRGTLSANTGGGNTALGTNAGSALSTGNSNIDIGIDVIGVAGESNTIRLGANLPDTSGASACHIGGIYNQSVDVTTASSMAIDATGKLGTVVSSRRFKHDIKPMDKASEAIMALKPVTFRYKSDAKNTPCFGLIAEEVAAVNPDLVIRNKNGEIWSVRYDQINAMLLNEFLKEHRKVEEQQATITELKSTVAKREKAFEATIAQLAARLKEQDSKIQKISARVEVGKSAPQVVANEP